MDRLVKRVQLGDKNSANDLVRLYYDQIYCYVFKFTQDKETSLDLTQDTFIRALNHIKLYKRSKGSFQSWLYTIAHNIVMNYFKSKNYKMKQREDELKEIMLLGQSIEEQVIQNEISQHLANSVIQLKSKYKDVIIMRFYQELSIPEISKYLKLNENTVKTRLRRGLNQMKELLERSEKIGR